MTHRSLRHIVALCCISLRPGFRHFAVSSAALAAARSCGVQAWEIASFQTSNLGARGRLSETGVLIKSLFGKHQNIARDHFEWVSFWKGDAKGYARTPMTMKAAVARVATVGSDAACLFMRCTLLQALKRLEYVGSFGPNSGGCEHMQTKSQWLSRPETLQATTFEIPGMCSLGMHFFNCVICF